MEAGMCMALQTALPRSTQWRGRPGVLSSSAASAGHQLRMAARCRTGGSGTAPKGGDIQRLVLSNEGRQKLNLASDREFYSFPRFVKHVDDGFLASLTQLYSERVPDGAEVLDLMSSWVSHLPPDRRYKRVVGHGLNAAELGRNPRLDHFFIKDLNQEQELAAADGSFDAVLCAVSVQYLQQPEKVFAEIYRVLRPGGVCIVSFSNRMFYDKAVAAWRDGSSYSRVQLVVQYFQCVAGFTQAEVVRAAPRTAGPEEEATGWLEQIRRSFLNMSKGTDPFYAVIAYRNFRPPSG